MGLDMYLRKVTMIGSSKYLKNLPSKVNPERVETITEHVMTWRKANQIHNWFVENIQDGVDNQATYTVGFDDLAKLRDICQEVLNNPDKSSELLPTRPGFFFGGTDYDEYYFTNLRETLKSLTDLLNEEGATYADYEYTCWW